MSEAHGPFRYDIRQGSLLGRTDCPVSQPWCSSTRTRTQQEILDAAVNGCCALVFGVCRLMRMTKKDRFTRYRVGVGGVEGRTEQKRQVDIDSGRGGEEDIRLTLYQTVLLRRADPCRFNFI